MIYPKIDLLTAITTGVDDTVFSEKGLYYPDSNSRGNTIVKVHVTFGDLSSEDIIDALTVSTY